MLRSAGRYHWFDGDGMVHAMAFEDGRARYRNRYVRTKAFGHEEAAGSALWSGVMESPGGNPVGASRGLPLKDTANTDLATGTTTETQLDDANTEFPSIDSRGWGAQARYAHTAHIADAKTVLFDGLLRYDRVTGERHDYRFGPGRFGSEAPFAAARRQPRRRRRLPTCAFGSCADNTVPTVVSAHDPRVPDPRGRAPRAQQTPRLLRAQIRRPSTGARAEPAGQARPRRSWCADARGGPPPAAIAVSSADGARASRSRSPPSG